MKHRACEPRGFPGAALRSWRVGRCGRRLATGRRALRRGRHQDFNKYFMWKARGGYIRDDVGPRLGSRAGIARGGCRASRTCSAMAICMRLESGGMRMLVVGRSLWGERRVRGATLADVKAFMRTQAERSAARNAAASRRRPHTTLRSQAPHDASVATASACTACAAVSAHAGTLRSAAARRCASGGQQQRQHRDQRRGRSYRFHSCLLAPRRSLDDPLRTSARNATATRIASAAYSMLFTYRVQRGQGSKICRASRAAARHQNLWRSPSATTTWLLLADGVSVQTVASNA